MRLIFGFLFILFSAGPLIGQYFPSEMWHEGYLVISSGDTLKGKIKYNLDNDAVQLERYNRIQAFSSRNVTFFEIFDLVTENYRQFYSIPYKVNMDYKVPRLFEMLYLGELSLVAREMIVQEAISATMSPLYGTRQRLSHKFFFVYKDGRVSNYEGKKNELLFIMRDKSKDIKNYIKKNKLRTDRLQDLVRITAFYDSF
ncbi:MAG: hypothetical protein O2887_08800 [Bacteroidetes bacterium]|nr:hypothetical protein [Bacteroidota bacterium]